MRVSSRACASCAAVQGGLLAGAVRPCPAPADDCAGAAPRGLLPRALTAFLGAKLVAHAVLGALLGLLGGAIQPTPGTRAILLLLAGALMVLFGLSMLGVPGVGKLLPRASSRGAGRGPLLLGAATVLVPCGVTLGVELVAVTSGTPSVEPPF